MDVDEILASLEAAEGATTETPEGESSTIKQIRDALKEAQKSQKELAKELKAERDRVAEFTKAQRETSQKAVWDSLGLSPKTMGLYNGDDVSEDAVKQWATDFGLGDFTGDTGGTTEDKSQGFEPVGTSTGSSAASSKVSRTDWLKLVASDPSAAQEMYKAGRVDLSEIDALRAQDQG